MNSDYFKCHILEELNGAEEYAVKAIEIKAMKPEWAKMLHEMSLQELDHAKYLYAMFKTYMELQKEAYGDSVPFFMSEDWDCVEYNYSTQTTKIEALQNI